MTDTKLYSWFLGPKAENYDILERMILEAMRDVTFWRRNFHPEDDILITEKVRRGESFQDSLALLQQEFLCLLANLKGDIPFYSPRYIGHMLGDQLLPAIAAYFAAMLHNPNNVSLEASPITTKYEFEVARQLGALMGYGDSMWGHITSGGTIANFEALWIARNLKFFPLAARDAARSLSLPEIEVRLPSGKSGNLVELNDSWTLLNIDPDESLALRSRIYDAFTKVQPSLTVREIEHKVDDEISAHSISNCGLLRFYSEMNDKSISDPAVLAPATSHYSILKIVEALGLGASQLMTVPVDSDFRADIDSLRQRLEHCIERKTPVIAVVAVLGTTEEGAIDQLHRIVALREEMRSKGLTFYLHCDGAWGGYVKTLFFDKENNPVDTPTSVREITKTWPTDEVFESYMATAHTDSVTIDPHKLGYIPYPCGAIVFRNEKVRELISTDAPYIFHPEERSERKFIGRYILEGSKPGAAAAACWFAHRIVPLNQDGYGLLIGKTMQSTQELSYRLNRDLAPELAKSGVLLCLLTDPPDGNILCFLVNRTGNTSLEVMNRINQAIYDELKFNPESVIQKHNFIISSTELSWQQYGLKGSTGKTSTDRHLQALGIDPAQFETTGRIKVLRSTVMNPWLSISRGGNPDYSVAFASVLKETIERVIAKFK